MALSQSINTPRLTESGLARELKVSRQAVNELVKRGILVKDKAGLIDVEMAKIAIQQRVRPSSKTSASLQDQEPPKPSKSDSNVTADADEGAEITSYHVAKTLREAAEAQMARIKLANMRGELVKKEEVERAAYTEARMLRDRIMGLPTKIAPLLATVSDPFEVERMLREALRQVLADYVRDVSAGVSA